MPSKYVQIGEKEGSRSPQGARGRHGKRDSPDRKELVGEASGKGQDSRIQQPNSVVQGLGSRGCGVDALSGENAGGILCSQIESTRHLIATEEQAIAAHAAALEELKHQLQQLEALAAEVASVETEEEE